MIDFTATTRKGNSKGVLEITIPSKKAKLEDIEEGDELRVWIKKKGDKTTWKLNNEGFLVETNQ